MNDLPKSESSDTKTENWCFAKDQGSMADPKPINLGRSGSVLARLSQQNLDWTGPRPRIFSKSRTYSDRSLPRLRGPWISVRKVSQPNGFHRIFWLGYFVWLNRFFPVHSGSFRFTPVLFSRPIKTALWWFPFCHDIFSSRVKKFRCYYG